MTGVIVLDKPRDFTSFDAVAVVRKLTHEKKIGHTGTLDPMATGVLPLLLGKGTKAASLLPDTSKTYEADFEFGKLTDTEDITGNVLETDNSGISQAALLEILPEFTGDIFQIPPMYSAVSVGGKRLYELARQGIVVERESRSVNISQLKVISYSPESRAGRLLVSCSKGTYIRTLINDMAKALGACGGVMTALRRTYACGFNLSDAVSLEQLRSLDSFEGVLKPLEKLFEEYPSVSVSEAQASRFLNGGELDLDRLKLPKMTLLEGMPVKILASVPEEDFLGLGKIDLEKSQMKILKIMK